VETLPPRVLWLFVLVPLFAGAAAARAQPPPPPPQELARVLEPIAVVSAEDVKVLLHSGVGVAAEMARVGGGVSGVFLVTEGLIVTGYGVEAGVDDANRVLEDHLHVISRNQALLEVLRSGRRLRRGDPGFDAAMAALKRESAALSVGSTGGFMEALLSRRSFLVMGRTAAEHYLTSYFGERLGRAIRDRLGLGGRLRALAVERLARDRMVTRPTWKRADGIARTMARLIDELVQISVEESVDVGRGDGGRGASPETVCPMIPTSVPGPFGPTISWTRGPCFRLQRQVTIPTARQASPRIVAPGPARPWVRVPPLAPAPPAPREATRRPPPPMPLPLVVRGSDPAPPPPGIEEELEARSPEATVPMRIGEGQALPQLGQIDFMKNWRNQ
jgi:hypothetical protein